MKNKDIYELYTVIGRNQQLTFCKTAYAAYKTFGKLREIGETVDKLRNAIIKEYGKPTGNGNYQLDPNNIPEEAKEKFEELFEMENDIEIHKVSRKVFDAEAEKLITENGVSVGDCAVLERWLVDEPVSDSDPEKPAQGS